MTYTSEETQEAIASPRKGDTWINGMVTKKFHDGPKGTGQFVRYKVIGRGNQAYSSVLGLWQKWCASGAVLIQRGPAEGSK